MKRERAGLFEYMIGTVESVERDSIILENGGIGFRIYTPDPYRFKTGGAKQKIKIYIYFYLREDTMTLYGFPTVEEKQFFQKLLGVSGIGPKVALALLSVASPGQIATAIEEENEKMLTSFTGIGKKTARQMILDLKGKLDSFIAPKAGHREERMEDGENSPLKEALLALRSLGFAEKEIENVLPYLLKEQLTTEQYIRLALQKMTS
jgi:Holliday junction DNA helicase subunit RuvA